jgi:hypothetical protein
LWSIRQELETKTQERSLQTFPKGEYMTLIAKPIIKDQYWVVTDGENKVGNVIADSSGFEVKLNGDLTHFSKVDEIQTKTKIRFEPVKPNKKPLSLPYPEYPTPENVWNSVLDVKRKLHLFTQTEKSKCYHVAGWFVMNQNDVETVEFCPKYIFIQRYPYKGPFKTEEEARTAINT